MKKTFQVNINGKIFHIDEDAYSLLQNYLSKLREAFPGDEGEEIVTDIECRISEHFDQRVATGASAIVLEDVNHVISVMGRPEEITSEASYEAEAESASRSANTGSGRPAPAPEPSMTGEAGAQMPGAGTPPPFHKKFFRDDRHKVFGGVLAGLAQYLGWDVTVLRVLVVVLALSVIRFDLFWPFILVYMILWMVIPSAKTPRQILEMRGEPVTIDNVGQTVIDSSVPPVAPVPDGGNEMARFINNVFLVIGRVILVALGLVGGLVAAGTGIVALVIIAGMCCLFFGATSLNFVEHFGISGISPYLDGWAMTLTMFAVMIPALCVCWAGMATLFKAKGMSATAVVSVVIIEVLLIVGAIVLGMMGHGEAVRMFTEALPVATALPVAGAIPTVLG